MCCSEMLPLLLITAASAAEVPLASPWMDATLPVDKRVHDAGLDAARDAARQSIATA